MVTYWSSLSFFREFFFTTKGTKFTKSFYRHSLKAFLCALCGLFTYLVIPRNRDSRHAPTGFYGLGIPLNDKPGIVQICFIVNQRFLVFVLVDIGAGTFGNCLSGGCIPLHGGAQPGI